MPFISITRLRLRNAWQLPRFIWLTLPAAKQARQAPGNLGMEALRDANLAFWTKSAWTDQAAMLAYMTSGAHRTAMPVLKHLCDEACGIHWEQESVVMPTWQEAHARLVQGARYVFVTKPSANQLAKVVVPPRV
jgi:quinol monooxygenase YgiN